MKTLIKKTIFGFLLALLAGGVVLAVFGGKTNVNTEITRVAPTPTFEKLPPPTNNLVLTQENLTLGITKALAKEIVTSNPNGPASSDSGSNIAILSPDALVKKALEEGARAFALGNLRPIISNHDITIVNTEDKEAIKKYLTSFQAILDLQFPGGIPVNMSEPDKTDFVSILSALDQTIQAFYALPAPVGMVSFHKQELALLKARRNVFALVKNYQVDPIQAYLALQEGEKISQEFISLDKEINAYASQKLNS